MSFFHRSSESSAVYNQRIPKIFTTLYLLTLTFVIMMQSPMNPFHVSLAGVDSSVFHYIASVMKNGGLIYRDTFDHKGPLLYFINYLGLNISYYSGTWFLEFITLLIWICITYRTARLFCKRIPACFAVFLSSTALIICFFGGNFPECYALPCISGALYIFTDYYINQKLSRIRLMICGGLLGCVLMLKPNLIAVWIVFCLSVFILKIYEKEAQTLFFCVIWFFLGLSLSILPILLYLIKMGIFMDFVNTYILFNLNYSKDAGLGSSLLLILKCFCRELVFPCFLISLIMLAAKNKAVYWRTYFAYFLLSVLLCNMSGNDYIYYRIMLVPCYVIPLSAFLSRFKINKNNTYPLQVMLVIMSAVIVQQWDSPVVHTLSEMKNMTAEIDLGDEHHQELFRLIEEYTDEDDTFIVYGNEDCFYYYSHRFASSKYSFQYPIILIDENMRRNFFSELDENMPSLILVQILWCNDEYIQDFLETHPYQCITDFDDYALYLRMDNRFH